MTDKPLTHKGNPGFIVNPVTGGKYHPTDHVPRHVVYEQLKAIPEQMIRRFRARDYNQRRYPWFCAVCDDETPHSTKNDDCLQCRDGAGARSPRARARNEGRQFYEGICPEHGATDFHVSCGKCAKCYNSVGAVRPAPDRSPRAVARLAGKKRFRARCPHHWDTDHYVNNGLCSECYTTTGTRRRGIAQNWWRAEARRLGKSTYTGVCEVHGETEHHVSNGKCAKCFSSNGQARPQSGVLIPYDLGAAMQRAGMSHETLARLFLVTPEMVAGWVLLGSFPPALRDTLRKVLK